MEGKAKKKKSDQTTRTIYCQSHRIEKWSSACMAVYEFAIFI